MNLTKTIRPGSELDYKIDWAAPPAEKGPWLAPGETISARTVTVEGPLTKLSDTEANGQVTAWARCDQMATIGSRAAVAVSIVTNMGRKDTRIIEMIVTR